MSIASGPTRLGIRHDGLTLSETPTVQENPSSCFFTMLAPNGSYTKSFTSSTSDMSAPIGSDTKCFSFSTPDALAPIGGGTRCFPSSTLDASASIGVTKYLSFNFGCVSFHCS